MDENKEHLPFYGIGPIPCFPMVVLTAIGIILSVKEVIPGRILAGKAVDILFIVIGIILIIEGILLFFCADLNGNLKDNIRSNQLKTNGSYRLVRNPCYSLFLFGCTGAVFISRNVLLFILPVLFWIEMTVVLIHTEEKWLRNLYGQEYMDYCKRVNRCIPWFPKKARGEEQRDEVS